MLVPGLVPNTHRALRLLSVLLLCAAGPLHSSPDGSLRPIPITQFLDYGGGGARFLRADGKGHVYLLVANSMTVVQVSAGVPVAKSQMKLKARSPLGIVLDAAVCPGGDWVILTAGDKTVRYFPRGEESPIPEPEWSVTGVACPGGSPTVAVEFMQLVGGPPAPRPTKPPGLMLRWDGERWVPYLDRLLDLTGKASGDEFINKTEAASRVVTTTDCGGRLWVGQAAFYNVRRITGAGRVDTTLESGPMEIKFAEPSVEERKMAERAIREMGAAGAKMHSPPITDRALLGLAEGPDGNLYILVAPRLARGKLAIDRYSPVEGRVMRTYVESLVGAQLASFVADASGIYWAERNGKAWRLPSEALEKASWEPAKEVRAH